MKNLLKIEMAVVLIAAATTSGCAASHLTRYDRQPGERVDETALGVRYPLCLRSDPRALRLTGDPMSDGLRRVIWTRHDGTQRYGTWYMSKEAHVSNPQPKDVNVWLAWPTAKENPVLQVAAAMVFAEKLVEDEDTPSTFWTLDAFEQCRQ